MGCCVLLGSVWSGHSVIFYSTGDPSYNTNAPEGALTNSGWQYQGTWSSFDGTVISSNAFITAKHVGGSVGEPFTFQPLLQLDDIFDISLGFLTVARSDQ